MSTRMCRLPEDLIGRADEIRAVMADAGSIELAAVSRCSVTSVVRLALRLGLDELNRRYPADSAEAGQDAA